MKCPNCNIEMKKIIRSSPHTYNIDPYWKCSKCGKIIEEKDYYGEKED